MRSTSVIARLALLRACGLQVNVDLRQAISKGRFRGHLRACIDLWHFELPDLAQRRQNIQPKLDVLGGSQ